MRIFSGKVLWSHDASWHDQGRVELTLVKVAVQ
jgi:hypothetical protein